jgi:hypothetical protein
LKHNEASLRSHLNGALPQPPPPFEKGGRKLSTRYSGKVVERVWREKKQDSSVFFEPKMAVEKDIGYSKVFHTEIWSKNRRNCQKIAL